MKLNFFIHQDWNSTLAMKIEDLKENSNLALQYKVYIKDKDIEKAMSNELKSRGFKPHSGIVQLNPNLVVDYVNLV